MCTYVFAYYLRRNNQSVIFEANQSDLESSTETLSEYLERDITSENLADIKQKVQDKYRYVRLHYYNLIKYLFYIYDNRYCDSRRKVLLEHVHEGYDQDWWEYSE